MKLISEPRVAAQALSSLKRRGRTVGFVPTMGALHQGHASLIRAARRENDVVVVSIFVNPLQFGPREDLKKYPRSLESDLEICRREGVDIVFHPSLRSMYPGSAPAYVEVPGLSGALCGVSRPGHFRGVATVVAKLFNIVGPDRAYFGQKDAQQAVIIKKMARDLDFPVAVRVLPVVREADGLAMSSRNRYLDPGERQEAIVLYRSLRHARRLIRAGERRTGPIRAAMLRMLASARNVTVDYVAFVDPLTLRPVKRLSGACLIAVAARVGTTRLIDNAIVRTR